MILARLVAEERLREPARPVDAAEAVAAGGRSGDELLDQLLVEEVPPAQIARDLELSEDLSDHWRRALALVRDRARSLAGRTRSGWAGSTLRTGAGGCCAGWPARWKQLPPPGFVCAAGITDPGPAVGLLLRCVSELPAGHGGAGRSGDWHGRGGMAGARAARA